MAVHIITQGAVAPELPAGTREYTSETALAYTEHDLILADLQGSLRSLREIERRISLIAESPVELHLCECLFRDAVVQFVACFGKHRNKLSVEDVFGNSPQARREMAFLEDLRNGYAAHNDGPRRQCMAVVIPNETNFVFDRFRLRFTVPSDEIIPAYIAMAETAVIYTIGRCKALHDLVLLELRTLTREQMLALPPAILRTPTAEETAQNRKDFRAGRAPKRQGRSGQKGQRP